MLSLPLHPSPLSYHILTSLVCPCFLELLDIAAGIACGYSRPLAARATFAPRAPQELHWLGRPLTTTEFTAYIPILAGLRVLKTVSLSAPAPGLKGSPPSLLPRQLCSHSQTRISRQVRPLSLTVSAEGGLLFIYRAQGPRSPGCISRDQASAPSRSRLARQPQSKPIGSLQDSLASIGG